MIIMPQFPMTYLDYRRGKIIVIGGMAAILNGKIPFHSRAALQQQEHKEIG